LSYEKSDFVTKSNQLPQFRAPFRTAFHKGSVLYDFMHALLVEATVASGAGLVPMPDCGFIGGKSALP
jgi:hypothetical protein